MTSVEAQLRRRLAELSRSHRQTLARELAAVIAHQINSPLGAVLANTEALEALLHSPTPDVSELTAIAADLRHDTQRAAEVIRQLNSFLRRSPFENTVLDIAEPVREAVSFHSALAVAPPLCVETSFASVPLSVKGSAVLLHQAVMSLIVNATDAMSHLPAGQRTLKIATALAEDTAEITISDNGLGIPEDKLVEIFEPFHTSKEHALGLGLSVVRRIVAAHNGKILAENRPGGGAVFRVTLPLSTE